jgi:aspartyl/asparaginyl-tRNA synthetase
LNGIAGRQLLPLNSDSSLNVAEFWMIEREIAFTDLADNNTSLAEKLRNTTSRCYRTNRQENLAFFDGRSRKGWSPAWSRQRVI